MENTSDTLTKPKYRLLACGNTNNTNDKPKTPENRLPVYENTIQTAHKQGLRKGHKCVVTLIIQITGIRLYTRWLV